MTTQADETIGTADDNIQERLEKYLSADEPQAKPEPAAPAPEAEQGAEEVPEVEPESDEGQAEEPSLAVSDLAKYLGIDESALDVDESGELHLKTKVDGQEGKAKLQDLITSYQLRAHLDNETRAAAENRKALQAHAAQVEQTIQERLGYVENLTNAAQAELQREFQGIPWQELRVNDPGQYAAYLADYQERQAQINNIAQVAANERQQFENQRTEQARQNRAEEAGKLLTVIPEWSDREVAIKENNETKAWAIKNGIPEQEYDGIPRAAYLGALRKAMLFDRMQGTKAAVEKRVIAAPKLVKPGQAPSRGPDSNIRNLKAQIQKSGGKDGIVEYLLATGKV